MQNHNPNGKIQSIYLIEPDEKLENAYRDYVAEFLKMDGKKLIDCDGGLLNDTDFGSFVQRLRNCSKGVNLPEGWVSSNTYWLLQQKRILGTINLRHYLTETLRDFGGHIGYSIRPSERNKGYGTMMLRMVLEKARQLGLQNVLITCSKDNYASARIIEKNGGMLDSESFSPRGQRITRRYWINLENQL
jgi:predicted acetyltransferase